MLFLDLPAHSISRFYPTVRALTDWYLDEWTSHGLPPSQCCGTCVAIGKQPAGVHRRDSLRRLDPMPDAAGPAWALTSRSPSEANHRSSIGLTVFGEPRPI